MSSGIERAKVDRFDGGVIVRIQVREIVHEFDEQDDVGPLGDLLRIWAERPDVAWMIVDLSRVEAMPSPFYGTLYEVRKLMLARDAAFRLCGLTPHVRYVLELTKLIDRFAIDRDVRAALDAVGTGEKPPIGKHRTFLGKRT